MNKHKLEKNYSKRQNICNNSLKAVKMSPPRFLYKYFSNVEYAIETIDSKSLYFQTPNNFNDIFDCAFSVGIDELLKMPITQETWKSIIYFCNEICKNNLPQVEPFPLKNYREIINYLNINLGKESTKKVIEKICSNLINIKPEKILIYCLSEIPNSLLMWAHYGNHLKGCCIRFDTTKDIPLFSSIKKVKYSKRICKITDKQKLYTKSNHWKYEKEWRILHTTENVNYNLCKTSSISAIIIGSNMDYLNIINLEKVAFKYKLPIFIALADKDNYIIKIDKKF